MSPQLIINNRSDNTLNNPELFRELVLGVSARFIKLADLYSLPIGELCFVMFFAFRLAFSLSTFFVHIGCIIFGGAKKKMIGVATRRVIAFVQNPKTLFNWAVSKFKSKPASVALAPIFSPSRRKRTIAGNIFSGTPIPAFVRFTDFDFIPKNIHANWLNR